MCAYETQLVLISFPLTLNRSLWAFCSAAHTAEFQKADASRRQSGMNKVVIIFGHHKILTEPILIQQSCQLTMQMFQPHS